MCYSIRSRRRGEYLRIALTVRRMSDALIRLVEDGTELTAEEKLLFEQLVTAIEPKESN